MVIKQVLSSRISGEDVVEDKAPSGPYMSLWIQALSHRVSGEGWGDSPSYGEQQYRINGISIHEYREEYGNQTRVTRYEAIDTLPPTDEEAACLGLHTPSEVQIPFLPDSQEKLPLVIETDDELTEALTLLGQLPDYPENVDSPEPTSGERLLPLSAFENDRRVEELVVKVDQSKNSDGSKKDDILQVSDVDDNSVKLTLWSKHSIVSNWTVGNWYWLHNPRVKVWKSSGTTKRKLSSTNDFMAEDMGSEVDLDQIDNLRQTHDIRLRAESTETSSVQSTRDSGSGDGSSGQSGASIEGKESNIEDPEDNVVTDIMEDLDFD